MKKAILLTLFSALVFLMKAQSSFRFADSAAQWNVLETQLGFCDCGWLQTHVYAFGADTMLNGKQYQNCHSSMFFTYNTFVRQDSLGKVYGLRTGDTIERILYDFSLLPGDTLSFPGSISGVEPGLCRIDSVDTVVLDKPRKRLYVSYELLQNIFYQDVWIEGIGAVKSHFLSPGTQWQMVDGPEFDLLCYFKGDTLIYHNTGFSGSSCNIDTLWNGIKESELYQAQISPNPVLGYTFQIVFSEMPPSPVQLALYDISGRQVHRELLYLKENNVQVEELEKGMYYYSISAANGKHSTGKIIFDAGEF